jgi:hypothetical protein
VTTRRIIDLVQTPKSFRQTLRNATYAAGLAWGAVMAAAVLYATATVIWPGLEGTRAEIEHAPSPLSSWIGGLLTLPMGAHLLTPFALLSALGFRKFGPSIARDLVIPFVAFAALAMAGLVWGGIALLPWLAMGVLLMAILLSRQPSLACLPHEPSPRSRSHRMVLGVGVMGTLAGPLLIACSTLFATITDPRAYAKYWLGETLVTWAWGGSILMVAAIIGALGGAVWPRRRQSGAMPT